MYLTPEQKRIGSRNFQRIVSSGINPERLNLATCIPQHMLGGPVQAGIVGVGRQGGGALLGACRKDFIEIVAVCDINPVHREQAIQTVIQSGGRRPREYADWREMAEKEKLEAVIVATPLWTHAEIAIGFLQAGVNVFGEKMMAYDVESCHRMIEVSRRQRKLLEIGYPRFYEPLYQAVYQNIIRPRVLGEIHYVRLQTHRNNSWRWDEKLPAKDFNPKQWGYPDWESLTNWRMYKRYSQGLVAELGSHQTSLAEWYLGSTAQSVYGRGGIDCYKDGREVDDHIHMTFEFPGGCAVELSVILSNSFGGLYEKFLGTEGTMILSDIDGGMYFPKGESGESGRSLSEKEKEGAEPWKTNWEIAFRTELWSFCSAIRQGTPLLCGPERALVSATAALAGNEALAKRERVTI